MTEMAHPWKAAESGVSARMTPALRPDVAVAVDLERLAFKVLAKTTNLKRPIAIYHAHAALITRALQDLRVCILACLRGYTMQAWTVAASGFEAAHAIGFIGESEKRAERWLAHSNLGRSPWSAFDAVNNSLAYLGLGESPQDREQLARHEYELYERLCIGKHVNPAAERNRYIAREPSKLILTPVFHRGRIKEAKLGLAMISRGVNMGIWAFRKAHLDEDGELDAEIISVTQRTAELASAWNADVGDDGDGSESKQRNGV